MSMALAALMATGCAGNWTLLVVRGVRADRVTTKEYGMQYPLVTNDTAEGRQQNRRVEIVLLKEGVSAQGARR